MTPLQVATAYTSLANGGFKVNPYLVERIENRDGEAVFTTVREVACPDCPEDDLSSLEIAAQQASQSLEANEFEEAESLDELLLSAPITEKPARRIIDARVAYIIDSILQDVIRRGTGIKAKELGRSDLAGKTGTTNGPTDAWFSGYHPQLVTTGVGWL